MTVFNDFGTLEPLGFQAVPATLDKPTYNPLVDYKVFTWQPSHVFAAGLATKSLVGLPTNFLQSLALIAVHEGLSDGKFGAQLTLKINTDGDKFAPTVVREWIRRVTCAVIEGLFVVTEVTLDFRKHNPTEIDPNTGLHVNNSEVLFDVLAVCTGKRRFNKEIASPEVSGSHFNVDLCNSILSKIEIDTNAWLELHPILRCAVGRVNLATDNGKLRMARLADAIYGKGLTHALRVLEGVVQEEEVAPEGENQGVTIQFDRTVRGGKSPRPVAKSLSSEDLNAHVLNVARWGGSRDFGITTVVSPGKRSLIRVTSLAGSFSFELPYVKVKATQPEPSVGRVGTLEVKGLGGTRYAPLVVQTRNINAGRMAGTPEEAVTEGDLELVTFFDAVGDMIADLTWEFRRALKGKGPIEPCDFPGYATRKFDALVDELTRQKGAGDKPGEWHDSQIESWDFRVLIRRVECRDAQTGFARNSRLWELIDAKAWVNPIDGSDLKVTCGVTSKSDPGGSAMGITDGLKQTLANGRERVIPAQAPWLVYAIGQFLDNPDRQNREELSKLKAHDLLHPTQIIDNGLGLPEGLAKKRVDGVWLAVDGKSANLFTEAKNNGDFGRLTSFGAQELKRVPAKVKKSGLSRTKATAIAREYLGENATPEDLESLGWKVEYTYKSTRSELRGAATFVRRYTLTQPEKAADVTTNKIGLAGGHKFFTDTMRGNLYVVIDNVSIPVLGMVAVETLVSKKMHGTVLAGLCAFLGHTRFDNPVLMHPKRQTGDAPEAHNDIVRKAQELLSQHPGHEDGSFEVVDEMTGHVGFAIPMLLPTYVMHEDERLSTRVSEDGCPRSVEIVRILGENIRIKRHDAECLEAVSALASNGGCRPGEPLVIEPDLEECDLIEDEFELVMEDTTPDREPDDYDLVFECQE